MVSRPFVHALFPRPLTGSLLLFYTEISVFEVGVTINTVHYIFLHTLPLFVLLIANRKKRNACFA